MSLRIALLAIGGVTVGWILFWTLVAMGPVAWVVIVPMLVIGVVQVYRTRAGQGPADVDVSDCSHCGTEIYLATDVGEGADGANRRTIYCTNCGEPIEIVTKRGSDRSVQNCAECGAPNDPGDEACTHCHAAL